MLGGLRLPDNPTLTKGKEGKMRRFLGPVWPVVGPDWGECIENFREDVLRRECYLDPRVQEYFRRKEELAPEKLEKKIQELERKLAELRKELVKYKGGPNASTGGRARR
jgi:hypothetical protein